MMSPPKQRLGRLLLLTIFLAAIAGGGRDAWAEPAAAHARSSGAAQPLPAGTPAPTAAVPQARGPALAPVADAAAPTPPARPLTRTNSPGMLVGGFVSSFFGVVNTLIGIVSITDDTSAGDPADDPYGTEEINKTVGKGFLVLGIAGLGAGIPLAVVGGRQVPIPPEERRVSTTPEIVLGPGYAGLRWSM
jgi:hypothetical protein